MKLTSLQFNWFLTGGIVVLLVLYVYLMQNTIFHAAEAQYYLVRAAEAASEITELEGRYLTQNQDFNLKLAYTKGFEDKQSQYLKVRSTLVRANRNEI